jgi:sulfur carrier protein
MDVVVNGTTFHVGAGSSLAEAVLLLAPTASGVAAALNGEVITRARWGSVTLHQGDIVEVVTAVQGG